MRKKITAEVKTELEAEKVEVKAEGEYQGPNGLKLYFSHLLGRFHFPLNPDSYWFFQHWQGLPKPTHGQEDQRNFGYFICRKGKIIYKTIPAEDMDFLPEIKIVPLQFRGPYNGIVPTAGNYFPNAVIVQNGRRLLAKKYNPLDRTLEAEDEHYLSDW